jgi:hypothetical protein
VVKFKPFKNIREEVKDIVCPGESQPSPQKDTP